MAAPGLLSLDVRILGTDVISRRLGIMADRAGDLTPAFRAIHDGRSEGLAKGEKGFLEIVKLQFESKGRRGGTPWQGYDAEPVYRRIKVAVGGGLDRILRWRPGRERLYPSLVVPTHPDHVFSVSRYGVEMGTSVLYALSHQKGIGEQKWDRIPVPRRPIIALTSRDARGWVRIIQRHVAATVGIAGVRAPL